MYTLKRLTPGRISAHTIAVTLFATAVIGGLIGIRVGNYQKRSATRSMQLFSLTDPATVPAFTGQVPANCQSLSILNMFVEVYSVDYSNSHILLDTGFLPCGSLVGQFDAYDAFLATNVSLNVESANFNFGPGQRMANQTSVVFIEGDPNYYPLDTFSVSFHIRGMYGTQPATPIPLNVGVSGQPLGYTLSYEIAASPDNTVVSVTVTASRNPTVVTFAILIMSLMWAMSLLAVALAYSSWFKSSRKIELPYMIFTVALLFAIPTIRNAMPYVPPIGVLMDQMVTGWALALLSLAVISNFINILYHIHQDTIAEDEKKKKENQVQNAYAMPQSTKYDSFVLRG